MANDPTVTVTIPTRLDKACARENSRFAIAGPQIRKAKSGATIAAATDGHVLAVVECDGDAPPEPAIVPASLLAKRKGGTRITLNGRASNGQQDADYCEGNFPPIDGVTPGKWPDDARVVGLNRKLLNNVADAIGAGDKLILVQDRHGAPIRVMACSEKKGTPRLSGVGVLMPLNVDPKDGYADAWAEARERLLK